MKSFVDGVSFILGKIAGVFISLFIVLALMFIVLLIFGFGETANYIINNTMLGFSYRYASGMVDLMGFLVIFFLCFYMLSGAYCHMLTFTGGKFNLCLRYFLLVIMTPVAFAIGFTMFIYFNPVGVYKAILSCGLYFVIPAILLVVTFVIFVFYGMFQVLIKRNEFYFDESL